MAEARDKYDEALDKYRQALEHALDTANDPYKAPELVVTTSKDVMNACWDMQIEYEAYFARSKRERGE